ncbi:MAG: hypothetical protein QNJ41_29715 [Xenococcaceae cyanobacterium MO_188.B32]|nr:hypothetical protein [Xenococcaceae cyanobacterium MO_188.B32]
MSDSLDKLAPMTKTTESRYGKLFIWGERRQHASPSAIASYLSGIRSWGLIHGL